MSKFPRKPGPHAPASPTSFRTHKYSIGSYVTVNGGSGQAAFKVIGHMPDGGDGPQYKIKSERETYERVAPESRLFPVGK